jgi:hypothetical protein
MTRDEAVREAALDLKIHTRGGATAGDSSGPLEIMRGLRGEVQPMLMSAYSESDAASAEHRNDEMGPTAEVGHVCRLRCQSLPR